MAQCKFKDEDEIVKKANNEIEIDEGASTGSTRDKKRSRNDEPHVILEIL